MSKRVLIIHTWGIGDWICFTPALRALQRGAPGAAVEVILGTPAVAPVVRHYEGVSVIGVGDVRKGPLGLAWRLLRNLGRSYDAAVFTAGIDSAKADAAAALIRAPLIAALTTRRGHRPRFIHRFQPYDHAAHRVDNNLALAGLLGAQPDRVDPFLPLADATIVRKGSVLIHPGSDPASRYKRWPAARFAAVAEQLLAHGTAVGVILGPAETELAPEFERLRANAAFSLHLDPAFDATARAIASHELLLHSDSGLGHVAAALGRKSVAIIGPADPVGSAPRGTAATTIRLGRPLPCQPCMRPGGRYGCPEQPCMRDIPVEAVARRVEEALQASP